MINKIIPILLIITLIFTVPVSAQSTDTVGVPVLMYHSVGEGDNIVVISPENFRKHLQAIEQNGFTPVSLDELISYVDYGFPLPEKPVCITFDDGYLDNYTAAFPMLKEFGYKATIFAIVSSVGKDTYKNTNHGITPHFSYDQAREMMASGLISVQSHTYDMHQSTEYEIGQARETVLRLENEGLMDYISHFSGDLMTAKTILEAELEKPLVAFAYPLGKYNAVTDYILKSNGVRVTMATSTGMNYIKKYDKNSLYNLNRYNMYNGVSAEQLIKWLNGE